MQCQNTRHVIKTTYHDLLHVDNYILSIVFDSSILKQNGNTLIFSLKRYFKNQSYSNLQRVDVRIITHRKKVKKIASTV